MYLFQRMLVRIEKGIAYSKECSLEFKKNIPKNDIRFKRFLLFQTVLVKTKKTVVRCLRNRRKIAVPKNTNKNEES